MCLRLTSKDLLGNLLASNAFTLNVTLSKEQLKDFENTLDDLIPGFIFFYTTDADFEEAFQEFSDCCGRDEKGHIYLKSECYRPIREELNRSLPISVTEIIESYADYYAETKLSGAIIDSLIWYVNRELKKTSNCNIEVREPTFTPCNSYAL